MRNLVKNKKKKGFTLIEMVAVVAIIGILAAILVPKIAGYMSEAKKTGAIDETRRVVQAYSTAEMKEKIGTFEKTATITELIGATGTDANAKASALIKSYLGIDNTNTLAKVLGRLPSDITVAECEGITEGTIEFTVNSNGVINTIAGVSRPVGNQ